VKPSFSEADERLCEQQLLVRWPPRERTDEIAASVKRREEAFPTEAVERLSHLLEQLGFRRPD
jgi:hypothetical protein